MKSLAINKERSDSHLISGVADFPLNLLSAGRGYDFIDGNFVHKTAVINWGGVAIGTNNIIGPYACLGEDAENINKRSSGKIWIGSDNVFREHSTVHLPTNSSRGTRIGNRNYLMAHSHVAHDCRLEDEIVMCNHAVLGGHVHVMKGAMLALNTSVHQFQVIGSWAMVGMNSCVTKPVNIFPGYTYIGIPARKLHRNELGLSRKKVKEKQLREENERFHSLKSQKGGCPS